MMSIAEIKSVIAAMCFALLLQSNSVLAGNAINGQPLYEKHCADCHDETGRYWMSTAPNFKKREKMHLPDYVLIVPIRNGKGTMPGFQGILKDKEILDIIAYLRTMM